MRAQFIYEKFTEDSDPIRDMGIGIIQKILKKYKHLIESYPEDKYGACLAVAADTGKLDYVKALLQCPETNVHFVSDYALRWSCAKGYTEIVKLLLDAGADVHAWQDQPMNNAIHYGKEEIVKILKNHITKEEEQKNIKESLNEKFTEDSDPIRDMGIGLRGLLTKEYNIIKSLSSEALATYIFNNCRVQAGAECVREIIKDALKYKNRNLTNENMTKIFFEQKRRASLSGYGDEIVKKYFKKKFNIVLDEDPINEKFTADSDPIKDMGIGIKHKIEEWLKKYNIDNYTINDDLTIDINGNVDLRKYHDMKELPHYIKFGVVSGSFEITGCKFETLKGFPEIVEGYFFCNDNHSLTSLKYAPKKVGTFVCWDYNRIHVNKKILFTYEDVLKVCDVKLAICDDVGEYSIARKKYDIYWK